MLQLGKYHFKRAETADEIEQIHRLNYRTFVEEIPQHTAQEPGRLVDKFHAKNTYFVAVSEGSVVGMVCFHDQPPTRSRRGCRSDHSRAPAIAPDGGATASGRTGASWWPDHDCPVVAGARARAAALRRGVHFGRCWNECRCTSVWAFERWGPQWPTALPRSCRCEFRFRWMSQSRSWRACGYRG